MKKIFILFIIFFIKKIYSISGTDDEIYDLNNSNDKTVDFENICPCDQTEGVCDMGCCCDEDCLNYMLEKEYFDSFKECDPSSTMSKMVNTNHNLNYCVKNYEKSLDDLYNPLVLAFQVLKKGFCPAYINLKEKKEEKNYDGYDNFIGDSNKNLSETLFIQKEDKGKCDLNIENNEDFDFSNITCGAPIALPNGLCLFESYPIQKLIDYEVTCSYHNDFNIVTKIRDYYKSGQSFSVNNYFYNNDKCTSIKCIIKKVEIIFYIESKKHVINYYYEETDDDYIDFTFVVKFLKDESDYKRSGNPGYIKGKPLIIGKKDKDNQYANITEIYKKFKNDIVFPIESYSENDFSNGDFYFDNYFDNKLTFEDIIIYGYKNEVLFNNIVSKLSTKVDDRMGIGKYGNADLRYKNDWKEIDSQENIKMNYNIYLLMGIYKESGATNNTQYEIKQYNYYKKEDTKNDNDYKYYYFISKFIKLKKVKREWWHAKSPGFIRLPQNIMYPFRVGTTTYATKKSNE